MNTTRSVLFALLSLGFLSVFANAQNADVNEVEKRKAELRAELKAQLVVLTSTSLFLEAKEFYGAGKYREAKVSMTHAYAANSAHTAWSNSKKPRV